MARIAPYWVAIWELVVLGFAGVFVATSVADEGGVTARLMLEVAGLAGFIALSLVMLWPWRGFVREVRERPDGGMAFTTIFGRTVVVEPGDVDGVREQLFIPQPGSTRVRTRDGERFYLGPFERKYELVDRVRALRS